MKSLFSSLSTGFLLAAGALYAGAQSYAPGDPLPGPNRMVSFGKPVVAEGSLGQAPSPMFFSAPRDKQPPLEWRSPSLMKDRGLPIDLPSALRLVNAQSLDIAIAVQQIEKSRADHDFAKYIWLPTIQSGGQYYRHDGPIENAFGATTVTPVTSANLGTGVAAIFTPSEAIFTALATRQIVRAARADLTTTVNDTTLAAATAYFTAQQARGELFGAEDTVKQAELLVARTKDLAGDKKLGGIILPLEVNRSKAELARRQQAAQSALEKWRVASADLVRKGELGEIDAKIMKAKAAHLESIAKREKADADLHLAEARVGVAREQENVSKSMLDYKDIKAPLYGVITERFHHTGRFVTPPAGTAKIDPLFTIVRMDTMRIMIDVPEGDAMFIRTGDKSLVRVKSLENKKFSGTVTRTSWVLDQATRTLRVEIDLANPKGELRPGQYAYGYIPIQYTGEDGKGVWTLPDSALLQKEEEGNFIFRIQDGKAVLTPVRLGIRVGHDVQVLKYRKTPAEPGAPAVWSVFNGEETIIMNPNSFVDGMKIEKK